MLVERLLMLSELIPTSHAHCTVHDSSEAYITKCAIILFLVLSYLIINLLHSKKTSKQLI